MNTETIIRQGLVTRPFEARLASEELRAKVKYFQKILSLKHNKSKPKIGRITKKINH